MMILKIKELENTLSISRSNIRFYEKQGLFSPERKDNNYREYTEQDIEVLKEIIIYRKMGFTVEEIKLIQNDELPFSEAMANVQHRIEDEIEQLNGSLKLIKQVAQENSSFDEIDISDISVDDLKKVTLTEVYDFLYYILKYSEKSIVSSFFDVFLSLSQFL